MTEILDLKTGRYTGTVNLQSKTSKGGGMSLRADFYDNVSPRLAIVQNNAEFILAPYVKAATSAIKTEIIGSYLEATTRSRQNTLATLVYKSTWLRLVDSGALRDAVQATVVRLNVANGVCVGSITIPFPRAGYEGFSFLGQGGQVYQLGRKDSDFQYWVVHEFGAGPSPNMKRFGIFPGEWSVPARPFLQRGIKRGMRAAKPILAEGIMRLDSFIGGMPIDVKITGLNMQREFNATNLDFVMAVAPPSGMYAWAGQISDIMHIIDGSFKLPFLESWLMSYAKGSVGLTKKVRRRQIRRKLWEKV